MKIKQRFSGLTASNENGLEIPRRKHASVLQRIVFVAIVFGITYAIIPATWKFAWAVTSLLAICIGTATAIYRHWHPTAPLFTKRWETALTWYDGLERHQQLYLNVVLCIPILCYAYILDAQNIFRPLVILFFAYCLAITAYDIIRIYIKLSKPLIGKALIAVGFAVGSNLAFGISGWIIGEMTHVPPSTFPHTLSFLAIGTVPFLFIIVGAIYIPISVVSAPCTIYLSKFAETSPGLVKRFIGFTMEAKSRKYVGLTLTFQVLFYAFVGTIAPKAFTHTIDLYGREIESAIGNSIYIFDMYPGTECKNMSDYRAASLGDENYILAVKQAGGIKFEPPRKCAL